MTDAFPGAVPELRVRDVAKAAVYYEKCLGFSWDWGIEGIGQVSRGSCRLFLTDDAFRGESAGWMPAVFWLNLEDRKQVDELYGTWRANDARLDAPPGAKPWNLYEFTAKDLDGNTLRVFYDFAHELPDRGGRTDDAALRDRARAESP